MTRRVKILIAIPAACAAVIALFAVTGLVARDGTGGSAGSPATAERATAYGAAAASDPVMGSDVGTAGKSTSGAEEQAVSAAVPPVSRPSAHHLLRTGDLSLLVARGALLSTVDRISGITAAMDGYVMSSSLGGRPADGMTMSEPQTVGEVTSRPDGGEPDSAGALEDPYASIVVRVPEQLFDTALKRFSKLGEVRSASTSSEDVTSQYVDLQARLRHHRAVERRLVGFLAETTNVNQMLAVQDRIDQVQLAIEELSAQLKSLREATTYGTLAVFLAEKDAKPAVVHSSDTFGGTFWNSMRLLGSGARVTGLVLTALAPFIVVFGGIGLAAWYVLRRTRRGRRQTAGPTLPA
jgi:hypothetical protein